MDATDSTDEYDDDAPGEHDALGDDYDPDSVHDEANVYDERTVEGPRGDDDGGLMGIGLGALLLVVGTFLFVVPEPATTAVGLALILAGIATVAFDRVY